MIAIADLPAHRLLSLSPDQRAALAYQLAGQERAARRAGADLPATRAAHLAVALGYAAHDPALARLAAALVGTDITPTQMRHILDAARGS